MIKKKFQIWNSRTTRMTSIKITFQGLLQISNQMQLFNPKYGIWFPFSFVPASTTSTIYVYEYQNLF